jgi:hypothetical protein
MNATTPDSQWYPFQDGATIGKRGSESGVILRDEEHPDGARITLERDGNTPFGITCGIYGRLMHTAFASSASEASEKYSAMKAQLSALVRSSGDDSAVQSFIDRFQ